MTGSDEVSLRLGALADDAPALLLDEVDAERFERLPPDKRDLAARRLAVLSAWTGDGRDAMFGNAADAAVRASMSRSGLFAVLAARREDGTWPLDGLRLHLGKTGVFPAGRAVKIAEAREEAARLIAEHPDMGTTELVRRLSSGSGADLAPTTLMRVLDGLGPERGISAPFAAGLLLDAASLDLVDGAGRRQRIYAVLDLGTGVAAGWAVLPDLRFEDGYEAAAAMAADVSSGMGAILADARIAVADESGVSVAVPADPAAFDLRRRASMAGWRQVAEPRRIGRGLVASLGRTVAGIAASAGFAPAGVVHRTRVARDLPRATPAVLARLDAAMLAHGERRLAMAEAGAGGAVAALRRALGPVLL